MKKIIFLFLINYLVVNHSYSQSTNVGASLGYGAGYFANIARIENFFEESAYSNYEFSGLVSFKALKPPFSVGTGITFQLLTSPERRYSFFKVPIGLDFEIGKKYQFLFGFGLYVQTFVSSNQKTYYEFEDLQAGFNVNMGFGYVLKDKYSFFLKIRKDNDFSKLYTEEVPSHFNRNYQNIYAYKYNVAIGFSIKLKQRKKRSMTVNKSIRWRSD